MVRSPGEIIVLSTHVQEGLTCLIWHMRYEAFNCGINWSPRFDHLCVCVCSFNFECPRLCCLLWKMFTEPPSYGQWLLFSFKLHLHWKKIHVYSIYIMIPDKELLTFTTYRIWWARLSWQPSSKWLQFFPRFPFRNRMWWIVVWYKLQLICPLKCYPNGAII